MNIEALTSYVIDKISQQDNSTANKIDFFKIMLKNNLIDKHYLQKACINDFYAIRLIENMKQETNTLNRDTVLDVAIFF